MDIILYLIQLIQHLYKQNCWLVLFICKYIPLKQWAYDDSKSPKYQKFKIDELPRIISYEQDWKWNDLIPYYEQRYGKTIKHTFRRVECDIPDDCTCPVCSAPKPYLTWNDGKKKSQIRCKVCLNRHSLSDDNHFSKTHKLRCPHCSRILEPVKNRKHFIIHKCKNPKCPFYLHNLKKVKKEHLNEEKSKYKLHYIYREFTVDFFRMDLNSLPKNASSLKFSKFDKNVMGLCLTYKVNLGLSLRKTAEALKEIHGIHISHQQVANYCKTAAVCIKPFTDYTYLAEYNSGAVVPEHMKYSDSPTFAEMYEKWKKYRKSLKNQISDSTWRNYEIAFNHFSELHDRKFISIRTNDLQQCLNAYNHKSQTTISSMRAVLKAMYQYAKLNEYIDRDLTEGLVYEWTNSTEQIHDRYSDEEIKTLWSKLYEINNVDIILIMIYTGLRPTELLEIQTENVHLDEKYIVGGMKTEAGKDRIIPLNDKIIPLIKNRYDPNKKYLINNKFGNHYTYGTYMNGNFNTCMGKLKMKHLPHDGRHTFASLMDSAGANDVCIKLIMGHSMKNDTTKGTYTHKTLEELLAEVNKI